MQKNTYIDNFIEMIIIERGLSKNTSISYKSDLQQLEKYCIKKNENIINLDENKLEIFLSGFRSKGFEKSSLARKISSYTQFFYLS